MKFGKTEVKYMLFAVMFAVIWFTLILPKLVAGGVENTSPVLQFLVFNVGIFIFLQIFLKSVTLGRKMNITGSIGVIALFMAIDIWSPPIMVSTAGQLLSGPILSASSSDYVFGLLAISLGLQGTLVYIFTYVLIPMVLLIIAAQTIPNFVREL